MLKIERFIFFTFIFIIGCYNNPTPTSEIIGADISDLRYLKYDCQALYDEIIFLENRERDLVIAQDERIKLSDGQQFWSSGIGNGDGIEASELNNVRGENNAVERVFKNKGCTINTD